jgi:hypothetical protein
MLFQELMRCKKAWGVTVPALRNAKTGKGRPKGSVAKPTDWSHSYWNSLSPQEKIDKKKEYTKINNQKKLGKKLPTPQQDIRQSFAAYVTADVLTQVLSVPGML